jgi:hypothetical protein
MATVLFRPHKYAQSTMTKTCHNGAVTNGMCIANFTKTGTLISGFCRNIDEICVLLGYYVASCANCLLTFQDNVSTLEDGTNTLSQNVGKQLAHNTVQYPTRAQISQVDYINPASYGWELTHCIQRQEKKLWKNDWFCSTSLFSFHTPVTFTM